MRSERSILNNNEDNANKTKRPLLVTHNNNNNNDTDIILVEYLNQPQESNYKIPATRVINMKFTAAVSFVFLAINSAQAFRSSFGGARLSSVATASGSSSSSSALCMKTIAVVGASGLLAQEAVYQALQNGDNVVGLTRNPSKVTIPQGSGGPKGGDPLPASDKLTLIAGDVTKKADVDKIFATGNAIDGVIVALGGKTSDVGETMLTDGTSNVIAAMKEKGVKRLAVVTSIGAGDSENQAPFFFKVLMWTAMKKIFKDKNNQEKVVQDSGLEYCIVRPGGLTVDRK